eukprot:TRINITY_DN938_c0_g1_i1.p1 TRINITY_DN938_c0_g1~~TRINITY_DN938_c0_g1_i1.p1  ORF type:complete len:640 (+),score=112.42 TRINITY_DN938_c0_g1_i1:319-2238(+)
MATATYLSQLNSSTFRQSHTRGVAESGEMNVPARAFVDGIVLQKSWTAACHRTRGCRLSSVTGELSGVPLFPKFLISLDHSRSQKAWGAGNYGSSRGRLRVSCAQVTGTKGGSCPFTSTMSNFTDARDSLSAMLLSHGSAMSATLVREQEEARSVAVPKSGGLPIPGPHPLDLIGNISDLSKIALYGIEEATLRYSREHGPLWRFTNGITSWTFTNDPDVVQHICSVNTKNYVDRFLPGVYEYVTHGKGILGSQGEYNRQHRKMCQPPFRNLSQIKTFTNSIADKVQGVINVWEQEKSITGDLALHMQRLTLDIIGEVAFSKDFGQTARIREDPRGLAPGDDKMRDKLLVAVNESQELMGKVFITPAPLLRMLRSLGEPGMKKMDQAFDDMQRIMTKVVQERREQLAATGDAGEDLLGVLLLAEDDEGKRLTDLELWEDVHDIMGAGHETTATTTTAAIFSISQHPEVEAKVVEEVRRVLGGRVPTYADIDQLQYTQMAVKEALRMYPPIPLFPRVVAKDDILPTGHKLPGGDVVFMSTYAMGRNPDVWENPEEFNPDRFLPEEERKRHKFAYVPFGAGPRMCLGPQFAMMSVTQIVAGLIQKLKFRAISPTGKSLPFAYDITMNFPGGVIMEASLRDQ